jgi:hypothetical protein
MICLDNERQNVATKEESDWKKRMGSRNSPLNIRLSETRVRRVRCCFLQTFLEEHAGLQKERLGEEKKRDEMRGEGMDDEREERRGGVLCSFEVLMDLRRRGKKKRDKTEKAATTGET